MQILLENTSVLERKLTITVPAQEVDEKTNTKLHELQGKVKLPGFRPGKVPFEVLKRRFGDSVRQEVIADTIQSTYFDALTEKNVRPAGLPHIAPEKTGFGEPLIYVATFEVYPEVDLKTLDNIEVYKPVATIKEEDIENMLQKLRKQYVTWEEISRGAKHGDQLVIDFLGKIKDEEFNGGSATDYKIELGAGRMLEDFEKPLYGLKAGEKAKFKLKFPKDYSDESVAGEKAEFEVTVHKIQEPHLPKMNEEFFKKVGVNEGGESKLRDELRGNMEQQLEHTLSNQFRQNLFDKLSALNEVELPKVLIDSEIQHLQQQSKREFAMYMGRKADELPDLPRDQFEEQAKKRVKLSLLLAEIIKKHSLHANAQKVRAKINAMAVTYEKPEEIISWYYADKKRLESIESIVLEEEAITELEKEASVVEKVMTFDEINNPQFAKEAKK